MERLTEHHVNKTLGAYMVCSGACIDDNFDCNGCKKLEEMVDRLAAYEDTGLGPEEITTEPYGCVFYCNRKCNLDGDFCAEGPGCPYEINAETAKHLLELARAEKDGRLMVMPFVAMVEQSLQNGKMAPKQDQRFNGRYAVVYVDKKKWTLPLIDICGGHYDKEEAEKRLAELTREEAEAALKKREEDNEDESIRSLGRQEPGT